MDTIVTPVTVITLDSTRIVHSIKADLVARYFPPVVRLVQYDMSLPVIAVSLMQNGQTYSLPSGAAANIRVHKPDSTYVYNPALGCDSTRNIVYFEVSQAMAAANGDGLAIVEIVVDGDIAGSSLITLHFEDNPVPEDAIESSDEWETIYELGERIIASTVTPVSTAAGMTDHNVVYLYTGTESGWNQGHMYYYNGTTWVDAGIAVTDTTLSVAGLAADAKATGDEISDLNDEITDEITALKEDFIDSLVTDTASGSIASFPDGADNVPVKSLTVDIEPVQDLHGQANPYPAGGGKNLTPYDTPLNVSAGASVQPVLFTVTLESGVAYTFSCKQSVNIPTSERNTLMIKDPNGGNHYEVAVANYNPTNLRHVYTYTPSESGAHEVRMWDVTPSVAVTYTEWQVEKGSAFTSYAPYSNICPISGHTSAVVTVSPTTDAQDGTSYTIDLNGTRYGGTLDVGTGEMTVTDANIASYNGETLPSTWISDRDVYASGTTPTTGAQVCYKLATPQTVQLTANEISTLLGQNNIWADTGDVEVEYRADTKLYIQKVMSS